ncbi:aromatic alcohol reductase [Lichenifustis flavocetrariae]|uniref:Aromatic alcohol reductase n=1 Tax=Lichenifustis flavocetrariae TaxID=2949735 RepID=A0AA42CQX8_9HYPH|nr:aromatic alcohol reductase [Lichenifustis flavocetrariae]MCW6511885.1 aromatic alcohol reductase [Lichenifustis flavocetrariae]
MTILLAGATGALGGRIARELRLRHADVKAIVRHGTTPDKVARLEALGVTVVELDPDDLSQVTEACRGASCLVSALNGLRPVIIDTQGVLLRAAVAAGVPRFIPSDFSLDFTKTQPGANRNLDLRRDFHKLLDAAPIKGTSILNGGFMELLAGQAPFLLFKPKRVLFFGDVDQRLDFTTMDDVAAFTAEAALDPTTPRVLRIAGDQVSARDLAAIAGKVTGTPFKTLRAGSLGALATVIRLLRAVAPGRRSVFPPWQGMQYMHNMFTGEGKLAPLDNGRYPGLRWTSVAEVLATR